MKRHGLGVIIVDDLEGVSKLALNLIIDQLSKKKDSSFALPTGETPLVLYSMIAKLQKKGKIDFLKSSFFQLDEFVGLKSKDKRSFTLYLEKKLFSKNNFKRKNIHTFNTSSKNPEKDCFEYERTVSKIGIDFCLLGLGENGHIAFNEPGSKVNSKTRLISLAKSTLNAKEKMLSSTVPEKAFTIGLSTIMKSKRIFVIAIGKKKAKAVSFAVKSKKISDINKCPVAVLNYHKNAVLIIDKEAASKL
jgi:glucosamine-6-phosphate deaminase